MRLIIRALLALAFLVAAALPVARPARADDWCWDDPVVSVGGRLIDIQVQMPSSKLLTMRSTTLTVIVPSNVSAAVVVDDVSAFPMRTTISRTGRAWNGVGPLPITVVTNVQSSGSYPIQVVARPVLNLAAPLSLLGTTSASGTSNVTLTMPMTLGS